MDIFDDASNALDFFTDIFNSVLSIHAPKKKRRAKRQTQPNWMNNDILHAMKNRDQYHQSKNTEQYKIWRNKVKCLIQNSKTKFYSDNINNN